MVSPKPDRLPYAALAGLSATAALILVTELMPVGVLAPMSRSLGVSTGQVGFLASAYAGAATVSAIPLTALTRRLPRRPLLLGVLSGFALGNVVTATTASYGVLLAARVGVGLLGGLAWSMLAGYAAAIAPEPQRGRAVAIALVGITVALVAGLPAGTVLSDQLGWRTTFFALAVGSVLVALWLAVTLPALRSSGANPRGPSRLVPVLRRPGVAAVLVVTGALLLGHQAAYTFLALLAEGAGVERPGLVLVTFGLSALAGIAFAGAVVDRHGHLLTTAGLAAVVVALVLVGAAGAHAPALFAAVALWGLAFGGLPTALQASLVRAAGVADATTAGSLQTTVYNTGVAVGSFAGGLVVDRAGVGALAWVALPPVIAALAVAIGLRSPTWAHPRRTSMTTGSCR